MGVMGSDVVAFYSNLDINKVKGVQKIALVLNFCITHILASIHWIFKILVSTRHNLGCIMWGRILKILCIEA